MLDDFTIYRVLEKLIADGTLYLNENDRNNLLVYKLSIDTGNGLSPEAHADILRMWKIVQGAETPLDVDPPLTLSQVFKDLSTASTMLSPLEQKFVEAMTRKTLERQTLSEAEMTQLLKVYADKGF